MLYICWLENRSLWTLFTYTTTNPKKKTAASSSCQFSNNITHGVTSYGATLRCLRWWNAYYGGRALAVSDKVNEGSWFMYKRKHQRIYAIPTFASCSPYNIHNFRENCDVDADPLFFTQHTSDIYRMCFFFAVMYLPSIILYGWMYYLALS